MSSGPLFETWAVAEAVKINLHLRLDARLFFWRDKIGSEVDLLVYAGSQPQVRDVADVCPWREWPEQALNLLQNK